MLENVELYFSSLIHGRDRSFLGWLILTLLIPFSLIFRMIGSIRNRLYDLKLLSIHRVSVPVISVGNITVGGSGKTPVVELLYREYQGKKRIAILTRGYRGDQLEKNGDQPTSDEAKLLARRCPGAIIVVDPDRVRGARKAIEAGAELIILDDGMQHRRLHRDIEIIVVDSRSQFGNGWTLPSGPLREGLAGLKRADLIVLTHVGSDCQENLFLTQEIYPKQSILKTKMAVSHWEDLDRTPVKVAGKKAGLFCGIAKPDSFLATAQSEGVDVIRTWILPDHAQIELNRLQRFSKEGEAIDLLICTEKDAVRLPDQFRLPIKIVYPVITFETIDKNILHHALDFLHNPI